MPNNIVFTEQQKSASDKIKSWWDSLSISASAKRFFVLLGAAGTGKTFLISHTITDELGLDYDDPRSVVFIAPTAKAAVVLLRNGIKTACTIHHFLYHTVETRKTKIVGGKPVVIVSSKFMRRKIKAEDKPKLIVLDECGMCGNDMFNDILNIGCPVICSGDTAQLPAVAQTPCLEFKNADFRLTEIIRQKNADLSPIVKTFTDFREGRMVNDGDYTDGVTSVHVMNRNAVLIPQLTEIIQTTLSDDGVLLCCRNSTRYRFNSFVRSICGYSGFPNDGETLVCDQNNYSIAIADDYILANGMTGKIKNFRIVDEKLGLARMSFAADFQKADFTDDILVETQPFIDGTFKYQPRTTVYRLDDGSYKIKRILQKKQPGEDIKAYRASCADEFTNKRRAIETLQLNRFEFGYCLTVWKSQGSTYRNVLFIDEADTFGADLRPNLRYVAASRPTKCLTIIH